MDTTQSERCKFKEITQNAKFGIFHKTQQATQLLKLVDKMCKYEMDVASIVDDTKRTRFFLSTEGQTGMVKPVYPPPSTSLSGGYNKNKSDSNAAKPLSRQIREWAHRFRPWPREYIHWM